MKICWARYLLWAVIAFLGSTAMLSSLAGCGQKGPLVLKKKEVANKDKISDKTDKSDDINKKQKK